MEKGKLEYNVLIHDFNSQKLKPFNIFTHRHIYNMAKKISEAYNKKLINRKEAKEILNGALKYALWARREYEISVGDAFETNLDKYKKIDAYYQSHMNIDVILNMVIRELREE